MMIKKPQNGNGRKKLQVGNDFLLKWGSVAVVAVIGAALVLVSRQQSQARADAREEARLEALAAEAAAEEETAAEEAAAAEESAQEEALAAEEEEAEAAEELLAQLEGIASYTIVTEEEELETLNAAYAQAAVLESSASSVLTGTSGTVFGTEYLFDGDLTTSWQEGEEDDGLGVTIDVTLEDGTELAGIAFWIGNESSSSRYEANNRPQDITLTVGSDGQEAAVQITLEDVMGQQVILFDSSVPAQTLEIRIDSVYEGSSYDDTVISEMSFLVAGDEETGDEEAGDEGE